MLDRLLAIGFRKIGRWSLIDGKPVCELEAEGQTRNILYCFASADEVLYVGKTTQPLKSRLYQYQKPGPTQSTNIKGNNLIKEQLNQGVEISVYAFPDSGMLKYGGFHLNIAAGLEDSIVSTLKPTWNAAGI